MSSLTRALSREIHNKFLSPLSYTSTVLRRTLLAEIVLAQFNRIDPDRLQQVGPERNCAEWLLKNGASVKFKGIPEYLSDYNLLPPVDVRIYLEAVDATNSSIASMGLVHFDGCKHINEVKLVNCSYLGNKAIPHLSYIRDSLTKLEIGNSRWYTTKGLLYLKDLKNLKELKLHHLTWLRNKEYLLEELTKALPDCSIDIK